MNRKIRLKICGLRSPENIAAVLRFQPDFIGFIFYRKSPRYVGGNYHWIGDLDPGFPVRKVGVFVDEPVERILEITKDTGIRLVQLHGIEKPADCRKLAEEGLQVIKVFPVGDRFSFTEVKEYVSCVDFFMFDTLGKYLGGNGIPFDWSLLEKYPFELPFFLSGGIGQDNIGHVGYLDHPMLFAVDVNSRLESRPGIKDTGLIKLFMKEFERVNYDKPEDEI